LLTKVDKRTRLTRKHDLPLCRAFAVFLEGVAKVKGGELIDGLANMRSGVELLREQNVLNFDGPIKIALAEAEAQGGDVQRALTIVDEALASAFAKMEGRRRPTTGTRHNWPSPAQPR
jgi:hypothetical protein